MEDPTEAFRRTMIETGQPYIDVKHAVEKWDTDQVRELFEVHNFLAPFVFVTRKKDGVRGYLEFTHSPRVYFNFVPD